MTLTPTQWRKLRDAAQPELDRHIHCEHQPHECRASFGEALQAEIADHNNRIQTDLLETYQRAVDAKG